MHVLTACKSVPSPPVCGQWDSRRAWLQSTEDAQALSAFFMSKPWTIRLKGSVIFSGYSQAWAVILCALLYARGRAHKDVLGHSPRPQWALSGQDQCHTRALVLEYDVPSVEVIGVMNAMTTYLHDLSSHLRYPGVPPSLLYTRFDTRIEYLRCLLDPITELVELLQVVQRMVRFRAHISRFWILT